MPPVLTVQKTCLGTVTPGCAREALGRGKAREVERRSKDYPYHEAKAEFGALARVRLAQPIPVEGRPGEFWWPPREMAQRSAVRGGTPEERRVLYDGEAERTASPPILVGGFRELGPSVGGEARLEEEGL